MNNALQRMVIQAEGDKILLWPAWPAEWNVEFKVHAPQNTVITGKYVDGKVVQVSVDPPERQADVQIMAELLADFNHDSRVDVSDLSLLAAHWLESGFTVQD